MDISIPYDKLQPSITEFSEKCERDELIIKQLIRNNQQFKDSLRTQTAREAFMQPNFLRTLLANSVKRSASGLHLKRYDDYMKDISLYLFMIAGPLAYEMLQKNLLLPSKTTVLDHLGKAPAIREGSLQISRIKDSLGTQGLPYYVWLAEDDTKIQPRTKYNKADDAIMGLELPLDNNGIPITSFFKFTTISAVQGYLRDYPKSSYAKLVTCRSLHPDGQTFIVVIYGTRGTDQSTAVQIRWDYLVKAFCDEGITVMGMYGNSDIFYIFRYIYYTIK